MTFSKTTIDKFKSAKTKEAYLSAQLEGFTGSLVDFDKAASAQAMAEWRKRDKATAEHFNY